MTVKKPPRKNTDDYLAMLAQKPVNYRNTSGAYIAEDDPRFPGRSDHGNIAARNNGRAKR